MKMGGKIRSEPEVTLKSSFRCLFDNDKNEKMTGSNQIR
jgi:hypothetical protein